tara:strand:- start:2978 stop:3313 length:336 start_codon:yes stop_codon:yes gene_type:complete
MKIYHNPRCQISRKTLKLILDKGFNPKIILYMKNKLGKVELENLVRKLKISPINLFRKNEKLFKVLNISKMKDDKLIKIMVENPKLIQRPIVEIEDKAIICRPPEKINCIL